MELQREQWSERRLFLLAALGSAVGLGNVWRFSYVAYQNGGGVFLIPYLVALVTAGVPLVMVEFFIGQKLQRGVTAAFKEMHPSFEWAGWSIIANGFIILTYYAVVIAWCFNYCYYSLTLAWGKSANSFFTETFLQASAGPFQIGGFRWPVLLTLLITWIIIAIIVSKGIRSIGKVVMFTVPIPVVLLLVLVARGITLPGSCQGLIYLVRPSFSKLLDYNVWLAAYGQVFFSLSLGFGILITYASFLTPKEDISGNAWITSVLDSAVSFIAGVAVFSALGFLASVQQSTVSDVATSGPGLVFVTYPTVISELPFAQALFGLLFFVMLITLGIDSAFPMVEVGIVAVGEKWKIARNLTIPVLCVSGFLIGLIFGTQSGVFWIEIVDHFTNNLALPFFGMIECVLIGWLFGAERARDFINAYARVKIGKWWTFVSNILHHVCCWCFFYASLWPESGRLMEDTG